MKGMVSAIYNELLSAAIGCKFSYNAELNFDGDTGRLVAVV